MALADYQTSVDDLVRDRDQVIQPEQRDAAIDSARLQYSADRPREVVVDQPTDGTSELDLPAGWADSSQLISIEYPIGQLPTALVPLADVSIYASPAGRKIRLPSATAAGSEARIVYTSWHLLDADDDTIPQRHRLAVASLAASILCGQLASYYATESESTISADTVNRQTMSDRWRARQRDLAAVYTQAVGVRPADRRMGASKTVQVQRPNSLGGRKLFHPPAGWH